MTEYFLVKGGGELKGEIRVNGAKNAALKSIAAALLFKDALTIENVPLVEDIFRMAELVKDLGAEVLLKGKTLVISPQNISKTDLNPEIAKRIRASIVLAGPLLARKKKVSFPHPGGCVIGKRPIDFFIEGWKAMGVKIKESQDEYTAYAETLSGCEITFRNISVTGTETLMMSAVLARGKTVLRNAALEPEITALAEFLNQCGAKIEGAGTNTVIITGTNSVPLEAKGRKIITIPDRIEAGSLLVLGAVLGNPLKISGSNPEHLAAPLAVLQEAGIPIEYGKDWIQVSSPHRIKSVNIKTREYPGFPTDLQALFAVFMTQAHGDSLIFETVFDGRLGYIEELIRMGAKITACDSHRIIVHGKTELHGREIETPDIRSGLAFIIASLIAKGESKINNIYQIDRGYEKIEERLNALGADIKRTSDIQ